MALSCRYIKLMNNFIAGLKGKAVHIVGVTGAEGSSILRFLLKHNIGNITVHDFNEENLLEKSFYLWHKGLTAIERENLYKQFVSDLKNTSLKTGKKYLENINEADLIFVSQSWRLYKDMNFPLWELTGKIPFYSLTRLYLDFAPAGIIAVTGTVGKGSVASIIVQLLKSTGKTVYFAGNDTWMPQLAEKLDEMTQDDILVLEISHRQLQDGFTRAPNMTVVTNLYPNHLDEVKWKDYGDLKLSLVQKQTASNIAVLNYDIPELRLADKLNSKAVYFSLNHPEMNTESVQKIFTDIMNTKSIHYTDNLLAGFTAVGLLGLTPAIMTAKLPYLIPLSARLELLATVNGVSIYDDIKSTTPWATLAAVNKLKDNIILICGGKTKGIDYADFAGEIKDKVKSVVFLKSEMSSQLIKILPNNIFQEVTEFEEALRLAYQKSKAGDNILVSPAAGFFYSEFIKGNKSLKRVITSLLPKERV